MSSPSASLPSPPMQEAPLPPSSDAAAAPSGGPVVAPVPQTMAEASSSSVPLLITPTASTAPPPPLPVNATPPAAPHPEEDPKSVSAVGLVDAGEAAAMEVEPSPAGPPPPSGPAPDVATSARGQATTSPTLPTAWTFAPQPALPTTPQPGKPDIALVVAEMHAAIERRVQRGDIDAVWKGISQEATRHVYRSRPSPNDAFFIIPLLLCNIIYASDISLAVSALSQHVTPLHYSSEPIYTQFATLISAVKTNSHSVIWKAVADIEITLSTLPSAEPIVSSHLRVVRYFLGLAQTRIRNDILSVVRDLYENLPVSELARYVGVSVDDVTENPAALGFALDSSSGLVTPVATPKSRRGPSSPRDYAALARGILSIETRV